MWELSGNTKINVDRFDTEQVYWDLIKHVIDQREIPSNISEVKIKINAAFDVSDYEFLCNSFAKSDSKLVFNLEFEE